MLILSMLKRIHQHDMKYTISNQRRRVIIWLQKRHLQLLNDV